MDTPNSFRMTRQTARILGAFLDSLEDGLYGLQLMEKTGLSSGTVYPVLRKLWAAGWLDSKWVVQDEQKEHEKRRQRGIPVRRCYSLTPSGRERASSHDRVLAELGARRVSDPRPGVVRA